MLVAGCGFEVEEPDLFLVTRTGAHGQKLTLLVNDGGTISCDGGKPKNLPDPQLLQARDLATSLNTDVSTKLRFSDKRAERVLVHGESAERHDVIPGHGAALSHKELSDLELFVVQAAANPCGLPS